jgi:FixJ family two-component response regulator
LAARERLVLGRIVCGDIRKAIASDLGVTPSHLSAILQGARRRLGKSTVAGLLRAYYVTVAAAEAEGGGFVASFARRGATG